MIIQKLLSEGNVQICVDMMLNADNSIAVIILPGFNLSKSGPFFLLSSIGRHCAEQGVNVFQFDYYGEGDSSGSYEDTDIEQVYLSIDMVKRYAKECGYHKFIYIGYGAGNVLASTMAFESDTIGLCLIAPDLEAHTRVEIVLSQSTEYDSFYINDKRYLWPNTMDTMSQRYWCSIIGIVDWLYYTPFNINLLRQLGEINAVHSLPQFSGKILVISPQEALPDEMNPEQCQVTDIPGLQYRSKKDWEAFDEWPKVWDNISNAIKFWINNFGILPDDSLKPVPDITEILSVDGLKQDPDAITRKSIAFLSNGIELTGIIHLPAQNKTNNFKYPCVIYEPGLGGSRVDMSRVGPWLGDQLANEGYICLRYDSMGSGVSEGEFYEVTWEKRYKNLCSAIDFLKSVVYADTSNIFLVSYCAGAKVVCLAADRIPEIKGCVLWSPYFIEKDSNKKFLVNIKKRPVIPVTGLWLGYDFLKEDRKYDFEQIFERIMAPVLVITGEDAEADNNIPLLLDWSQKSNTKEILQYQGAHCFLYKYMEPILRDTIRYLNKIGGRNGENGHLS